MSFVSPNPCFSTYAFLGTPSFINSEPELGFMQILCANAPTKVELKSAQWYCTEVQYSILYLYKKEYKKVVQKNNSIRNWTIKKNIIYKIIKSKYNH